MIVVLTLIKRYAALRLLSFNLIVYNLIKSENRYQLIAANPDFTKLIQHLFRENLVEYR